MWFGIHNRGSAVTNEAVVTEIIATWLGTRECFLSDKKAFLKLFPHMLGMKMMSLALCCRAASLEIWWNCCSLTFPFGRTFKRPFR